MIRWRTVPVVFMALGAWLAFVAGDVAQAQGSSNVCTAPELDVPVVECAALLAIYESTTGQNWNIKDGWGEAPIVCDWTGVGCTSIGGTPHVTSLVLQSNNLNGPLSAAVGALSQLTTLDLYDNFLSGNIPPILGTLGELTYIDLGLNLLEGEIPYPLSAATEPQFLFLDGNRLSGPLPAGLCSANLASATAKYNTLDVVNTDPCFNTLSVFDDWDTTQTVPPLGVTAVINDLSTGADAADTSQAEIEISWTPIAFTAGEGGYVILSGPSTGGSFQRFHGQTTGKTSSSAIINVSGDPQAYVFVVRTFSGPTQRNKSTLLSSESNTARVEGVGIMLLSADAGSPALYLALLGPLALLVASILAYFLAGRRA